MRDIALGNPLLNKKDYTIKRRWDDDVVFRNQARGTEVKKPKEFTNVSCFLFFFFFPCQCESGVGCRLTRFVVRIC